MPEKTRLPIVRKALITGATSGLGEAFSNFLELKGYSVFRTGRNLQKQNDLALDLAKSEERKKLIEWIRCEVPDLIINNAGFGLYGPSCSLSIDEQLDMIEVNVKAAIELSLESAKALLKAGRKGTILNISSAAAFFSYPDFNVYAASKACLLHFSLALDAELHTQGIRVLCSCPGPVATDFRHRASKGLSTPPSRIPLEKAVRILWRQLERQKTLVIFDWRTRLQVGLSHLLPKWLLNPLLKKTIQLMTSGK